MHMGGEVGTQAGEHLVCNAMTLLSQLMQNPRLRVHIVKDDTVDNIPL